ncbi:MAG: hypothetical protein II919_08920 [Lachnospiraceae bacterium]|nr:hypothetical protein [Lachnospiraceae bacterium]
MEDKKTYVSIDLCRDYSQIAYYFTDSMSEPESASTIVGEQKYLIPTVAGKLNDRDEWCIGDDAVFKDNRGEAESVSDLIPAVLNDTKLHLCGMEYSGEQVLKEYFRCLLKLLEVNYHMQSIDYLVVTVEYPDKTLVNLIRGILEEIGFSRENVKVLGHSESLIYYTVFQKRELWVNDVLIFDFTKNQFLVRRLNTVRARVPQPIIVEEMDLSSKFTIDLLETPEGRERLDEKFLSVVKELCAKHIVSTVYLTGIGFYEKWMKNSIRFLCAKRRVFQGYNLFVKGACYAALSAHGQGEADKYQFVCSGRTLINIELEVVKGEKTVPVVLSKAGTNWYEAGARAEGILDGCREVKLRLNSSISKNSKILTVNLMGFPPRPNKTTRIEIILSYKSDRQCVIYIRDIGFGEFFKSSGEQVKEIINIEDYL